MPAKRPPSYSESFIEFDRVPMYDLSVQIRDNPTPLIIEPVKEPVYSTFVVKSSIHLFLISVFETIFFFSYVSEKEDRAIEQTINTYYTPFKNSCPSWSNVTRWVVYEILVGEEIDDITKAGINSYNNRKQINTKLLYYSLASSTFFLGILVSVGSFLAYKRIKIEWLKIISENISMVLLLGLYEYVFFMTIIINYDSISTDELNSYIANGIYDCVKN
jgi:hypothetical protein